MCTYNTYMARSTGTHCYPTHYEGVTYGCVWLCSCNAASDNFTLVRGSDMGNIAIGKKVVVIEGWGREGKEGE